MSDKRSNEKLDELRERLYARGETTPVRSRTDIKSSQTQPVRKSWSDVVPPVTPPSANSQEVDSFEEPPKKPSFLNKYRSRLLLIGVVFFVISIALSSIYILLGRNTVSGSNISIGITGPFTVGGGEVLPLQVGITNHNSVAIESATIVVQYPPGTRSVEGDGAEMFSERVPISESIAPGETRNISLRARVFGEENQENDIRVSIEYRMTGSSATFFKEAEPLRYKISHAPVSIRVESPDSISPGQEANVKLVITSNSPAPIDNLIVKADYPNAFSFVRSEPAPASGRNIWNISRLDPEASVTIDLYGTLSGSAGQNYVIKFTTGVASERSPGELVSILGVADREIKLEDQFISANVTIDGKNDGTVTVAPNAQTTVVIEVRNNSSATVRDVMVDARLSGNALVDSQVTTSNGYYDSNTRTIRFDRGGLSQMAPGSTERLSFSIRPEAGNVQSPQIGISVDLSGRRLSDSNTREQITEAAKRTIMVEGRLVASGRVVDVTGGTVPPVAGRTTSYRIEWRVQNSGNSASGAILTATLPAYVEWTGDGAGGNWSYDSSSRTIEWRAGNIPSGDTVSGTFGVSILPSASLVGRTPTLVENIQLRADDSFTGSVVRASGGNVTTEIDGQRDSGVVRSN